MNDDNFSRSADAGPSLFSIAYLPPVSYVKALLHAEEIIIESKEHFVKQTYRNRCHIFGANGRLPLIIPLSHSGLFSKAIEDIEMITEERWKIIHWRSIISSYRRSPFFEYYEDELKELFYSNESNLFKFNINCLELIFRILKRPLRYKLTDQYKKDISFTDLRDSFNPKKKAPSSLSKYHQVFENEHGFIEDLSILDVICNLGPDSISYLYQ
ncbi:MAG TPA: WbqC family protein [Bacteroidia bacterium]|nr:WbqC family protein [Bacteroidia bacterium]HNS11265.1 WbqC family protein [Bacteroidia bacterium]